MSVLGLGIIVFAIQFSPAASYPHLTLEGFTYSSLFRRHCIATMVGWNYADRCQGQRFGRAWSNSLSNVEAASPDTYATAR